MTRSRSVRLTRLWNECHVFMMALYSWSICCSFTFFSQTSRLRGDVGSIGPGVFPHANCPQGDVGVGTCDNNLECFIPLDAPKGRFIVAFRPLHDLVNLAQNPLSASHMRLQMLR